MVSIIIPTLANHDYLCQTLESLSKLSFNNYEIIVSYNGSKEKSKEIEGKITKYKNTIFFQATEYGEIAKSCNEAFRISKGNYIAFVHDDVVIEEKDWDIKLKEVLDKYLEIGMVGGSEAKYVDRKKDEVKQNYDELIECDWSPTISMTKREYMLMGCMFDEFYLVGMEDIDWAISFRRIRKKVVLRKILHNHIGNIGSYSLFEENKNFLDYYSKEGPRVRYFLNKNKDVLSKEYYEKAMEFWKDKDRNSKKAGGKNYI